MKNNFFKQAIIISLIVHISILMAVSFSLKKERPEIEKKIEIIYRNRNNRTREERIIQQQEQRYKQERKEDIDQIDIREEKEEIFQMDQDIINDNIYERGIEELDKIREELKEEIINKNRKIIISEIKVNEIKNKVYLEYNDKIRDKIKQKVYENTRDLELQKGKVYITFVLTKDGYLQRMQLNDRETKASEVLIQRSKKSVQQASPYDPFIKEMPYPELTFNVLIIIK